jgi:hypothetical protein
LLDLVPKRSMASSTTQRIRPASTSATKRWKSGRQSAVSRAQPWSRNQRSGGTAALFFAKKARMASSCRAGSWLGSLTRT